MIQKYRFKDLQRIWGAVSLLQVSLNDLYPKPGADADGNFVPAVIEPVQLDAGTCSKKLVS